MKRILVFILLLFPLLVSSQEYKIESNFKLGKVYKITVRRAKIDAQEPISKDLAQLTQIEATFTESDKKLICNWKYGETIALGPKQLVNKIDSEFVELFNIYRGFEIEMLFDPVLGSIELLNYEEIKKNLETGFLKIYNNEKTKIDSSTIVLIKQQLEPTYSTPELLLSIYFPEVLLYFNLYSVSISEGDILQMEYSYPNPFGGESFPVVGEIKIIKKERNKLIIQNEETVDQEEVNRILKELVEDMSKLGDSPIVKDEIPVFTLKINTKYYYNLKRKIIYKVIRKKVIEIAGNTQTEVLEVNLIK